MERTAVFVAGAANASVLLDATNSCAISWEVLQFPRSALMVGVYGTKEDSLVLPTIWANIGAIQPGASPFNPSQAPSPTIYQQLLNEIGNLSELNTIDKSSLVAAINEIYQTGGGGITSPDIAKILVMDLATYDALETKEPTTLYLVTG